MSQLLFKDIIRRKREGETLSSKEIEYFVSAYTKGEIPDYQAASFLMACFINQLNFTETRALTKAMIDSGKILNLSQIKSPKIDKHSTGGVGDKISLILAPLVAASGVCVPMLSGRSLGYTGGTIDKLEAIPHLRTNLTESAIIEQLQQIGLVITSPTSEICPADKKIYALRDATETVESLPLIAASIMSKKIAEGVEGLVLDVKVGRGAFLKDIKTAKRLAKMMIRLGKEFKVKTVALLTNMDEPLGRYVGNGLEIIETIEALKGEIESNIKELTFALGEEMLLLSKIAKNRKAGRRLLEEKLKNGAGLKKFQEMVKAQGGDQKIINNYQLLVNAKYKFYATAPRTGSIKAIDALAVGRLCLELGGGRKKKEDIIDHSVGFKFLKRSGEKIKKGEAFAEIYANEQEKGRMVKDKLEEKIIISPTPILKRPLIYERIDGD